MEMCNSFYWWLENNVIVSSTTTGSETRRPPLAALSRLAPPFSNTNPAGTSNTQAKAGYLTPNNVQHDEYGQLADGSVPKALSNSNSSGSTPRRMDEYSTSLVPPGMSSGGGGMSELTRRPSVAIGGIRSPSNVPNNVMESDHLNTNVHSLALNNSNSRSPAGLIPTGFAPTTNYSNNNSINNNNSMAAASTARKNSLDHFGLRRTSLSQQQQQQQQQPYSSSFSHQQISSYDGGGGGLYSGDEMKDTSVGHGQLERGRSSLRRGPALSGSNSFIGGNAGGGGGYHEPSASNPSYNFQQAMNDHFDHYKRPPSRDRSRDPSMDRFSRSSRQSSIALTRQESSIMGSRGPSPAPTPSMAVFRSNSRQRPPLLSSSPTPSASRFHADTAATGIDGANNNIITNSNASLQRRMATPIRVRSLLVIISESELFMNYYPHFSFLLFPVWFIIDQ